MEEILNEYKDRLRILCENLDIDYEKMIELDSLLFFAMSAVYNSERKKANKDNVFSIES